MNRIRKLSAVLLAALVLVCTAFSALPAAADGGAPSIVSTLTDGLRQSGSRKTFDVWAKDASGNKLTPLVTLNGEPVNPTWDDSVKTSFTLLFTEADEGENIVTVSAAANGKTTTETYRIFYQKAEPGEQIGSIFLSVELITLGNDCIVEPCAVPIYEGETGAQLLLRVLQDEYGLKCHYTGRPESGFYLSSVESPAYDNICDALRAALEDNGFTIMESEVDEIGEFCFTFGSGWMYCVNNVFPNVGWADYYPADGDVVRSQFTLAYGSDIGGGYAMGGGDSGFFDVADKDALVKQLALAAQAGKTGSAEYEAARAAYLTYDVSQEEADTAAQALSRALAPEPPATEPTAESSTEPETVPATEPSSEAGTEPDTTAETEASPTETEAPTSTTGEADFSEGASESPETGVSTVLPVGLAALCCAAVLAAAGRARKQARP